jgi:hypothetical protein
MRAAPSFEMPRWKVSALNGWKRLGIFVLLALALGTGAPASEKPGYGKDHEGRPHLQLCKHKRSTRR